MLVLCTVKDLNPSMYIGNIGLWGHPLPNNCLREGDAPKQGPQGRTEEDHGIEFFYLDLGGTWCSVVQEKLENCLLPTPRQAVRQSLYASCYYMGKTTSNRLR